MSLVFLNGLLYHPGHTWLKLEADGTALVGISDFAQEQLGEVAFVDLPAIESTFTTSEEFGSVESVKAVNALFMPVAGTVRDVNRALLDEPSSINTDPYGSGWMLRIVPTTLSTDELMSATVYAQFIR